MSCAVTRMRDPDRRMLPSRTVVTPQRVGDLADVLGLALEGECRSSGGHLQALNLRQEIDDLLGQPVAEVFIFLITTHVGER